MIAHVSGILESTDKNSIVIDVDGIGFKIFASNNLLSEMPPVGEKIKVYTEQIVREDSNSLYGFSSKEEKNLFNALLSVSGIGPKSALSLVSGMPASELVSAIAQGNVSAISSIPGIGNKTAQRIIVELKEKIAKTYAVPSSEMAKGFAGDQGLVSDAISALVTLGYSPREARDVLLKINIDSLKVKSVEEIIKMALKNLI